MSDDLRDELEGSLSEAASAAHEWKSLMEHPGWSRLVAFAQEQLSLRMQAVCRTPVGGEMTIFAQEFLKGEFSGIEFVLSAPEAQFEQADLKRKTLSKELEAENETQTAISTASTGERVGSPFGGDE